MTGLSLGSWLLMSQPRADPQARAHRAGPWSDGRLQAWIRNKASQGRLGFPALSTPAPWVRRSERPRFEDLAYAARRVTSSLRRSAQQARVDDHRVMATPGAGSTQEKPVVRIQPSARWMPLKLRDLWKSRELIAFFSWRDISVRYKQTALGVAWVVIQPLLATLVFSVFFGN